MALVAVVSFNAHIIATADDSEVLTQVSEEFVMPSDEPAEVPDEVIVEEAVVMCDEPCEEPAEEIEEIEEVEVTIDETPEVYVDYEPVETDGLEVEAEEPTAYHYDVEAYNAGYEPWALWGDYYATVLHVISVERDDLDYDLITVRYDNGTRWEYQFVQYGSDLEAGDILACIMCMNGTDAIADDTVMSTKYIGWGDIAW